MTSFDTQDENKSREQLLQEISELRSELTAVRQ